VPTLLRLDCSPRGRNAHSWRFADELTQRLQLATPGTSVIHRALFDAPPAYVDEAFSKVMTTHTTPELARETPALTLSEKLIVELETSDMLLIASPVHNFTVPAPLKAWLDQVVRFGRTFRSTPEGKIGLLRDRPTWIVLSSGGYFTQGKVRQPEFAAPYLQAILGCMGIRDVTVLRLEGLSRGDEAAAATWATARQELDRRFGLASAAG
jgi:FMN-dependent NADH-azoreductase